MPFHQARDLFTLHDVGTPAGKPAWMNLRARRLPEWRGEPADLMGPGLYAVFFRDTLTYIGLYAGKRDRPFGGSVLERWYKHLTYHTLRAPEIEFTAGQIETIRTLPGELAETISAHAEALVGQWGGSCTANKVRFAQRHWDVFGPGHEEALLDALSFGYWRLPDDWQTDLPADAGKSPSGWVKRNWLRTVERDLINKLEPRCNNETAATDGMIGASRTAVEAAVAALFPPRTATEQPAVPVDAADDATPAEQQLRDAVSAAGEQLIDDLQQTCPSGLILYATDKPDLRIGLYDRINRIKVLIEVDPGWRGVTHAGVDACLALGFEDARVLPSGKTGFTIDPDRHGAPDLYALAGAALGAIAS